LRRSYRYFSGANDPFIVPPAAHILEKAINSRDVSYERVNGYTNLISPVGRFMGVDVVDMLE